MNGLLGFIGLLLAIYGFWNGISAEIQATTIMHQIYGALMFILGALGIVCVTVANSSGYTFEHNYLYGTMRI